MCIFSLGIGGIFPGGIVGIGGISGIVGIGIELNLTGNGLDDLGNGE